MRPSQKKLLKQGIIIVVLMAISFCCLYVNIVETFFDESNRLMHVVYPTIKSIIRYMIHISLVLAWCISVRSRILDKRIRRHMTAVGILIMLWFVVRVCKWDFVMSYDRDLVRYLWYGYYIPIILLPLQGIFIADLVGRPDGYHSPKWMDLLYIPAVILIAGVFTNDIHHLVFSFPSGVENFDQIYKHEKLYFVIIAWLLILTVWFIVNLLRKSRVPGDKKYQKLPFVVLLGFVAVWFIHTLNLFPNDQTLLNCMLIILLLESQIQTGLIRSNSNYDELFQRSTISAQIVNDHYAVQYTSGSAVNIDIELLKHSQDCSIPSGDMFLHSKPISGGYILWQDNISEINSILEQLQETQDQLGESYELKKAEVNLKEQKFHAEEKSRLYDRIAREVSPQLDKADSILVQARKKPYDSNEPLAQVCVISAYIKRLSNLILVSEDKTSVPSNELESCLRESMDNLRLANVLTFLDSKCEDYLLTANIISVYHLFETVTEYLFDRMNAMMVTLDCKEGTLRLRMQIGCNESTAELTLPELTVNDGSVSAEIQDEDIVIHVFLSEGGVGQ